MAPDGEKPLKEVEHDLEESRKRAEDLEKNIEKAEGKHPPPIDHAEDGGVF
ncbi:MAG TPA: hypothetical protein VMU59_12860 [Caulobacteraceae bacterium]|nr:hypothetical protein [Caulobacteraceae bacterium]